MKIVDWLITRAMRTPYSHLGGYMNRWWLVPYLDKGRYGCGPVDFRRRPLAWLLQRFGIAVRIHHILRSDDSRAPHDHPWWYITVILSGGYLNVTPVYDDSGRQIGERRKWCTAGSIRFARARSLHRLVVPDGGSCWTLFITGPKKREWGFMCPDGRWVWHRVFERRGCT